MEEKLKKLMENEEFTKKLEQTESAEAAIKLFAEYGVEVTEDDLKSMMAAVPEGEMDEAALENVSGGGLIGSLILIGVVNYLRNRAKQHRGRHG